MRIVYVTNSPAPYRVPVFNRVAATPGVELHVIFCCAREPNRAWDLPAQQFDATVLRERYRTVNDRYIHNNPDVLSALKRIGPDVVVTDGFNPTHLYAYGYALAKGLVHVSMTDGTLQSESALSPLHRAVRHLVYARTRAFVSASQGGTRLFASYGIAAQRCFLSCLCIDNQAFWHGPEQAGKRYDFIFCARIEHAKNPLFAHAVTLAAARRLGRPVSVLYVGDGAAASALRQACADHADLVQAHFHGFAVQGELPALYRSARVFLFPTAWDVWGVVANEACAAGLPVLVSPYAGVVGELVIDGENGFVRELQVDQWAESAALLLSDPVLQQAFSARSLELVSQYTFDQAAAGLVAACQS